MACFRWMLVIALGMGFMSFALVGGCSSAKDPWAVKPGPKVLAYFPPLYSLAASVAGDDAQVLSLITHVGPHHFDPTSRDAQKLQRADMFFSIGLGLDDSITRKLTNTANNPKLVHKPLGMLLPKESLREGGCACCKHAGHDHKHDPNQVEYDPHVWLGIAEAIRMVEGIRDELVSVDRAHISGYAARAETLISQLKALEAEGKALIASKKEKPKLITFHDSLFYLARSFGVEIVDSIVAPGQEPSAKKLAALVAACKKHEVRLIAVEPQYPTNTAARTLLDELKRNGIDAQFVEIDPLETADVRDLTPDYYLRKMRGNLHNLAAALK